MYYTDEVTKEIKHYTLEKTATWLQLDKKHRINVQAVAQSAKLHNMWAALRPLTRLGSIWLKFVVPKMLSSSSCWTLAPTHRKRWSPVSRRYTPPFDSLSSESLTAIGNDPVSNFALWSQRGGRILEQHVGVPSADHTKHLASNSWSLTGELYLMKETNTKAWGLSGKDIYDVCIFAAKKDET